MPHGSHPPCVTPTQPCVAHMVCIAKVWLLPMRHPHTTNICTLSACGLGYDLRQMVPNTMLLCARALHSQCICAPVCEVCVWQASASTTRATRTLSELEQSWRWRLALFDSWSGARQCGGGVGPRTSCLSVCLSVCLSAGRQAGRQAGSMPLHETSKCVICVCQ